MTHFRCLAAFVFFANAAALEVSPIEKVITLIENMKKEVVADGKKEAKSYAKFACFCKDTTKTKSAAIKKTKDKIDVLSASIVDKSQTKTAKSTELDERKEKQEALSAKLESETSRCTKKKAEYEEENADLSKAHSGLKKAIKAMKDSKGKKSFLQTSAHKNLVDTLAVADAMNMITEPKSKDIVSMIQTAVDPSDPEYDFHSNDVIKLLLSLEKDFGNQIKVSDAEYAKTKKACDALKKSLADQMTANSDAMKALGKSINKLSTELADHSSDLVDREGDMKDDEKYLKELTTKCEGRAEDWDQRTTQRNDEITALSTALSILSGDVKKRADKVNERAMFIQRLRVAMPEVLADGTEVSKEQAAPLSSETVQKPISFLQGVTDTANANSFLSRSTLSARDVQKSKAISLITKEGQRLGSLLLTSLAVRSAADPFAKVKGLIQKLMERLLEEAEGESTKKGFCDTELAKNRKERDFRFEDTNDLSDELGGLEAKRDKLTQEIKELTTDLKTLNKDYKSTVADRKTTKAENTETVKTAKEGLEAVNKALLTLKAFYDQAAKAAFIQESQPSAGFKGSYSGKQEGTHAILGLLDTIASDFERTISNTEQNEDDAQREFVKFTQTTKSSIAAKEKTKSMDEQDLKTTKTSLKTKMEDLKTAQKLLDGALKELEELKPTCIDTGMSYKDRVAKREEEMNALKKALCLLDEENVEPLCK